MYNYPLLYSDIFFIVRTLISCFGLFTIIKFLTYFITWSFVYHKVICACKTVVLEHLTTNQVLVYVHNSLLIVYNGLVSCSFSYTTHVSSPNIAEHGYPTHFLANFRNLLQFIVDTSINTKKHG